MTTHVACVQSSKFQQIGDQQYVVINGVLVLATAISGPYYTKAICQASCTGTGSPPPTCSPKRVQMGTADGVGLGTVSISVNFPYQVPAGSKFIVSMAAVRTLLPDAVFTNPIATYIPAGGNPINIPLDATSPAKANTGGLGDIVGQAWIFSSAKTSTTYSSVTITLTVTAQSVGGPDRIMLLGAALYLEPNAGGTLDKTQQNSGVGTPATTGAVTTSFNCEYVQAAFVVMDSLTGAAWGNGFNNGQQIGQVFSVKGNGHSIALQEGYKILSTIQSVNASLTVAGYGAPLPSWAGVMTTYVEQ